MDEGLSKAVREAFVSLYKDGLIYRDRRLVNWDPKFQSAISDLEVENKETKGHLWQINYPVADMEGRFITIATTRPETMLGDTAIAVHPDDARYKDLVGKKAIIPLVGRQIPIITDEHSDPEKGTGAVKITPAHDFNDFAVGQRHKLPMPSILDVEGRITLDEIDGDLAAVPNVADPAFVRGLAGKDRFEARKLILAELERIGLFDQAVPHVSQVPYAERGGAVVEPRLTTQWFCNAAELAKPAIEAVKDGRMEFVPQQWENTFFAWMNNLQPWCISRQLWWGHRIPAWYGPDGKCFVGHSEDEVRAEVRAHYGNDAELVQDEDVLDTWFSSGLWPFSTLGWPEKTKELDRYYPTDVLVTGFDIIFFWVSRMMMMGMRFMGEVPFKKIYIHGLVRDEKGQKMSKSKGNVIDPLSLMDEYGTDAVRWTICSLAGPGRNINMGPARVETSRNFVTKIRNAVTFWERSEAKSVAGFDTASVQLPLCRWILAELNQTIADAGAALDAFRFDDYAKAIYHFVWDSFCDWFIELSKPALQGDSAGEVRATAAYVLENLFRLMQPVMPFVAEELAVRFGTAQPGEMTKAHWPEAAKITDSDAASAEVNWVIQLITAIRSVRAEMNVPHQSLFDIRLHEAPSDVRAIATRWRDIILRLARASDISPISGPIQKDAAQLVVRNVTIVLPLAGVIDFEAEKNRLAKEIEKYKAQATRIEAQLANENYVAKAPPEVVEESRNNLTAMKQEVEKLSAALQRIA